MTDHLSLYLNVINAYEPAAIPGKNKFTFISKKTGIPQVYVWDGAKGTVESFGKFEDRIMSVYHSPTGSKTIMGMDYLGNEKQQFYLVDEQGNDEPLVVSPEHFHIFGGWSSDESKVMYSSNRRNPGSFDIFVLDMATRQETVVFEYDGPCEPVRWLNNSTTHIVISIKETNIDNTLYILNIETKEQTKIGPDNGTARYQSLTFTKDGKTGFVLSDVGNDTTSIYRFAIEEPGELEQIVEQTIWDVEGLSLSPNQEMLVYTANEGGTSVLNAYDLSSKTSRQLAGVPSGVISSITWTDDQHFVFTLKSPVMPGDIWAYDYQEGRAQRLTNFGVSPQIEHLWMEPELCKFKSFDGLEVPYFYYAREKNPTAAVIYVHGGPEGQTKAEFNPVIQYLVSQGFAVAAPNVRGSLGYGRNYLQLDDGRKRMDAVADLANLVEDLVQVQGIDRDKVGVMGRSYGGFMVLAALTHYPELWAAGVDIVGISHFKTFLENTGSWRRRLRECEYGFLGKDDDFFEEIAPLNHLAAIQAPLLVFHGRNDTRVPVSEAEQLTTEMLEMEKDVELYVFDDEGHQTEKLENHITMNTKIVEFFNKKLNANG